MALALSLAAHVSFFAFAPRMRSGDAQLATASQPFTVQIAQAPAKAPEATPAPPEPEPQAAPPRPRAPVRPPSRREPRIEPAPMVVPRRDAPPMQPPAPAPALDMLAMIEERREKRRAAEEAHRRSPAAEAPQEDAASRNLKTITGREGVSGVFQILRKSTRTGEFAFNGWRPDARGRWREVYEVDAGLGGNIELAMVRRMIELIRTHYTGDFNWESYRLQRVVRLSARLEDNEGLEDFLMREFFGTPTVNPRR
ncbi:MAG: hypothetical protein ABIR98_05925 [Usitatibacter sp.]